MTDFNHEYAKTIINIHLYGEIEICATVDMLPLSAPLRAGGSIRYEDLYINGKMIHPDSVYNPVRLYLLDNRKIAD